MEAFIGEIRMFAGNFPPRDWAFCDGQIMSISANEALFSILGTTYGGDGRTSFGLPDLRGRVPIGPRNGPGLTDRRLGQKGGRESITLTTNQLPSHTHTSQLRASSDESSLSDPTNAVLSNSGGRDPEFAPASNLINMSSESIATGYTGGGRSIDIEQPFLGMNYIIALIGTYPPRS